MNYKKLMEKLGSRKFWALLASLVVSVLTMFNCDENTVLQVTSLLTTFGSVVAYIIGESVVDSQRVRKESDNESEK